MITLFIILTLINLATSIFSYKKKNYKTAMFNAFVTGWCLMCLFYHSGLN